MEPTQITVPSSSSSLIEPEQANTYKGLGVATVKMLQTRELCGDVTTYVKDKYNFREEYEKRLLSEPMIWRYNVRGDTNALASFGQVDIINMVSEEFKSKLLISGGNNGSLSFYVVDTTKEFCHGERNTPDCVWPLNIRNKDGFSKSPGNLWKLITDPVNTSSSPISCIKKLGKPCQHKILITTFFESHQPCGSVYVLSLDDPLVINTRFPKIVENLDRIQSFNCNIRTADSNCDGSQALIGTEYGARVINVETGAWSWACRCENNITALHFTNSENIALCGLNNGAIVSVDLRQGPDSYARLTNHRIPLHSSVSRETKERGFKLVGSIYPFGTISTPSAITCLTSLKLYDDQYFLANSMGDIKLYDHRMVQSGAALSYKQNVSSGYEDIHHAVDPSEKFVMSGGVQLWSIKSGELLSEETLFTSFIPFQYWWGQKEDKCERVNNIYGEHSNFEEAWVSTPNGLYRMTW